MVLNDDTDDIFNIFFSIQTCGTPSIFSQIWVSHILHAAYREDIKKVMKNI